MGKKIVIISSSGLVGFAYLVDMGMGLDLVARTLLLTAIWVVLLGIFLEQRKR